MASKIQLGITISMLNDSATSLTLYFSAALTAMLGQRKLQL